jgi:hypothetical protein
MNTVWRLLLVCVALLLLAPPVYAKGPPDKIVISGPGLNESVTITELSVLQHLGLGALEDFGQRIDPQPQRPGGYQIDRLVRQGASYWTFDRLTYYPPAPGERGVIFYAGLRAVSGGSSEYDGQWFYATPTGDTSMTRLVTEILPRPALPVTGAADELADTPMVWSVLLLLSGLALHLANRWAQCALRRR